MIYKCRRCAIQLHYKWERVCRECSTFRWVRSRYFSGAALAQTEVAKARRRGILPDPRTLPCADCAGYATEYDHRDYNHPLIVAPVCRGCNARRGHAIPKQWTAIEWNEYAARARAARLRRRGNPIDFSGAPTADVWQIERAA